MAFFRCDAVEEMSQDNKLLATVINFVFKEESASLCCASVKKLFQEPLPVLENAPEEGKVAALDCCSGRTFMCGFSARRAWREKGLKREAHCRLGKQNKSLELVQVRMCCREETADECPLS